MLTGPGQAGLGRGTGVSGLLVFDDFTVALPGAAQSFDRTVVGSLPRRWAQWASDGSSAFQVSTIRALSLPQSIVSQAGSRVSARAWNTTPQPADVQAGAAVYLNTLIPTGVFVRGSNLGSVQANYYGLTITRGMTVQLTCVVAGASTLLAQVQSTDYVSSRWVRITLEASGNALSDQVYRTDTGLYLNRLGQWQSDPAWAIGITDSALSGSGLAGVERAAAYAGAAALDDFFVYPLVANQASPQVALI